jgi:hypothetical protein
MYIDAPHITELIADKLLRALPSVTSKKAFSFLEMNFILSTRSTTSVIDWRSTPHTTLDWMGSTDDETISWASKTLAGQCKYGLLPFNPEQACLIGEFEFVIRNLDSLVWKAPGCRILFGVECNHTDHIVFTRGVIEYNGQGRLLATISE